MFTSAGCFASMDSLVMFVQKAHVLGGRNESCHNISIYLLGSQQSVDMRSFAFETFRCEKGRGTLHGIFLPMELHRTGGHMAQLCRSGHAGYACRPVGGLFVGQIVCTRERHADIHRHGLYKNVFSRRT